MVRLRCKKRNSLINIQQKKTYKSLQKITRGLSIQVYLCLINSYKSILCSNFSSSLIAFFTLLKSFFADVHVIYTKRIKKNQFVHLMAEKKIEEVIIEGFKHKKI